MFFCLILQIEAKVMKFKLAIAVFFILILCACTGSPPVPPRIIIADDPVLQLARDTKIKTTTLVGKSLIKLTEGDYIYPRLSPDAKHLLYANSIVRKGIEGTSIHKLDLKTKKRLTLLDEFKANQYRHYKVYVASLKWDKQETIIAGLSDGDGDVDVTKVTFDSNSGKRLHEESSDFDSYKLTKEFSTIKGSILKIFPEWLEREEMVLHDALFQYASIVPNRGVILQKRYAGYDSDIWFIDIKNKKQNRILKLTDNKHHALFGGAVTVGENIIFLIDRDDGAYLFELSSSGKLKPLGFFENDMQGCFLKVKYTATGEAIFMLVLNRSYEVGNNPLFRYSVKNGLQQITDYKQYYDVNISSDGSLVAASYWVGDKRHINVSRRKK